ncbi:hypothetical protein P152DRAFT_395832 [Eremomyces bilateralis CBS 781.70]|uniref:LysM domain-containing protein n=1 Tax=Eremomyces bilateralis CBS 781.70 TaxID=1392243 RepID=A0A6G1G3W9_9PEZI|nr:uncharacterized protein P152DRAFT_395832 [Eremomyces bilateralis CBS 781.70]KAF1812797.1 hypothetical protein P152DRAFT_395832 [Eremomyces bilateralis CBS 781.70]
MATFVSFFVTLLCLSIVEAGHIYHHPHRLIQRQESTPGAPTQPGITPKCNKFYTIISGDSCNSVETTFEITHEDFIAWNPDVSSDCISNFWPDYSYCVGIATPDAPTLPGTSPNCNKYHTIVDGDTCSTVEEAYGITHEQFIEWNTDVSSDCVTNFWLDNAYCVGVGASPSAAPSTSIPVTFPSSSSIPITSAPVNSTYSTRYPVTSINISSTTVDETWPPAKTQAGQPASCNRWHLVLAADTCETIYRMYSSTLNKKQLLEWNPALSADCSGLYYQWWVCVGIQVQTTPALSFPPVTSGSDAPPEPTEYTPTLVPTIDSSFIPSPTQPGTAPECDGWYKTSTNDTCYDLLQNFGYVSMEQFVLWNPAVGADCTALLADTYYCIADFPSPPQPPTVPPTPSPVSGGNPANCTTWYQMTGSDTCDSIALMFGTFSKDEFMTWNPLVGGDCSGLTEYLWYCVAIPGTPATRTAPPPTVTTLPPGTEPLPQQTGISTGCTKYWLVGGDDDCYSIIYGNEISVDDFYAWNPAIGAGCQGLEEGYFVCVGTDVPMTTTPGDSSSTIIPDPSSSSIPPGTPTPGDGSSTITATPSSSALLPSSSGTPTTSDTPVTTPDPFQTDMISGCRRFYLVQSEDGCFDIAASAGIDLE